MSKKYDLKGKYSLVTGASMGIGKAIAEGLAKEGVNVALCALPSEEKLLKDVAADLEKQYRINTWTFAIDLAADNGPKALHTEVEKCLPHLDILVNCAGIDVHGYFYKLSWEIQEKLLRVNVRAYMALMHAVLPDMIKRNQGRILNVVSMGAFQPLPFMALYGASKAFLQSLSEAVGCELNDTNVIISTLNPNMVNTQLSIKLPQDMKLFKFSPPISAQFAAEKAINTIKNGRTICIPTKMDWFTAFILNRFLNRNIQKLLTRSLLKSAQQ